MKKILYILALPILIFAASCTKHEKKPIEGDYAQLAIGLNIEGLTKGEVYAITEDAEKALNDVKVVVFDIDGIEEPIIEDFEGGLTGTIRVKPGTKRIYAVINGPEISSSITEAEFKATALKLEDYNSPSEDFIMYGAYGSDVTVEASETKDIPINVSRLVARIHLSAIISWLPSAYDSVQVKSVFLENVVGTQYLDGSLDATSKTSYWYNQYGSGEFSAEEVTYKGYAEVWASPSDTLESEVACNLYCYPNSNTAFADMSSATTYKTTQATILCLAVEIAGEMKYYPMNIGSLKANHSYTVEVVLYNIGTDHPAKPLELGTLDVTVKVSEWDAGNQVHGEI